MPTHMIALMKWTNSLKNTPENSYLYIKETEPRVINFPTIETNKHRRALTDLPLNFTKHLRKK